MKKAFILIIIILCLLSLRSVTLAVPVPFSIQVGDTFSITPGCDKTENDGLGAAPTGCQGKFNNIQRYGGFPQVPGFNKMRVYPTEDQLKQLWSFIRFLWKIIRFFI